MLRHLTFGKNPGPYKVAILIKDLAFREGEIRHYYLAPLLRAGFSQNEIIAFNLAYNERNKAPSSLVKEHLTRLEKAVSRLGIPYLLIADSTYFKFLCKTRKAEPHIGSILDTIWAHNSSTTMIRAALTVNYQQLFFDPSLESRLELGVQALVTEVQGGAPLFQGTINANIQKLWSLPEINDALDNLHKFPAVTCDTETLGLHINEYQVVSIAFATNQKNAIAFEVEWHSFADDVKRKLLSFFRTYQGKLIFHNAPFDTRMLIRYLFMRDIDDIKNMLHGLDTLYRNFDDTRILTYLAVNSASGNELGLKAQAFEFMGNYALEEISNVRSLETEDLLNYNAADALATWYVYDKYMPVVMKEQRDTYLELFKPSLKVITQMELTGMPMDHREINTLVKTMNDAESSFRKDIASSPVIQDFEKSLRMWAAVDATAKLKKKVKTEDDFLGLNFNPASPKQMRQLLFEYLQLPSNRFTDTGLASTDSKTLEELIQYVKTTYQLPD